MVTQKCLIAGPSTMQLILDSVISLLGGSECVSFSIESGNDGIFVVEGRLVVLRDGPEGSFASFSKQTHILIFENN
jgi:hypothetical protein